MKKQKGFTLVELIIAMAVGALIMTALYASMNMAQRSSGSVGRKVVTQQDARAVLDIMAMEIRMASYNPSMSTGIWETIPTAICNSMGNVVPLKVNKGVQVAESDRILIAMDLNNPPLDRDKSEIGDEENEYIEYALDKNQKTITRNVRCSGDSDILGGDDLATVVRNEDANIPLFRYFDKDGNETGSIPDIRSVRITIVADTKYRDNLTQQTRRMTYTTDVLVKNHVLCP
ncbi:MAG: prepilin-type N-terminal cleavage/methylation domain-containing protein [Smithella sp.]|nr:prepilin-type N-terminal cleavage/methylation domain-containing protein [Smithella sp.]